MLKWLRSINWTPILASALVLVLALWILSAYPNNEANPTANQNPFERVIGCLSPEGWTALFTAALFISTIALWSVTNKAANAAQISARAAERALTDLEGPYLYPVIVANKINESFHSFARYDHPSSAHTPAKPSVRVAFKNFGRTVAIPQSVVASLFVGDADDVIEGDKGELLQEIVIAPGDMSVSIRREILKPIDPSEYQSIKNETKRIFLRGTIVFWDMFGNGYIQAFCLAWDRKTDRLMAWGIRRNKRKPFDPDKPPTG